MSDLEVKETRLLPKLTVGMTFVVNEYPRIQVPRKQSTEPEKFQELSTSKQQMIMKRLINRVKDL